MNDDGSSQTRLTNIGAIDYMPAWSPDGARIAFSSGRDGIYNFEIYVMNADDSGQTRLTNHPTFDEDPAWSPDGTRIAFTAFRGGDYETYVMNADGSGQTNLTNSGNANREPAWWPDGAQIALNSFAPGGSDIHVMNRDGTQLANRTNSAILANAQPDWQPLPLTISPSSGLVAQTQEMDLVFFVTKPSAAITSVTATLNGQDVSTALAACVVPGRLLYGRTFRCPDVRARSAPGQFTLAVTVAFSDGTSASDTAYWTVLAVTEP